MSEQLGEPIQVSGNLVWTKPLSRRPADVVVAEPMKG